MDAKILESQVREIIEPTVRRLGYDLVAVEVIGARGNPILRVSIDKAGGISADDCALVSERISPELDADDPFPTSYQLEVSSPGIDRPVQRMSDFARFIGFRVRLRCSTGAVRRRCTGTLRATTDVPPGVVVDVDGTELHFPLDVIDRAHLSLTLEEFQTLAEETPHDE